MRRQVTELEQLLAAVSSANISESLLIDRYSSSFVDFWGDVMETQEFLELEEDLGITWLDE